MDAHDHEEACRGRWNHFVESQGSKDSRIQCGRVSRSHGASEGILNQDGKVAGNQDRRVAVRGALDD